MRSLKDRLKNPDTSSRPTRNVYGTQKEQSAHDMAKEMARDFMSQVQFTGASFPGPPGPGVITGGTATQLLAKKSSADYDTQWVDSIVNASNYGFVAGDTGQIDRTGALATALAAMKNGDVLMLPAGRHLITAGQTINKSVIIMSTGNDSGFKFVPSTPNDTLFHFTATGAPTICKNEEGQLIGAGLKSIGIFGDRSVRANGVFIDHCDWDVMDNVLFWGLDGFAVDRNKSRECQWVNTYAKYCGHPGLTDPNDGVPSFIMRSDSGAGDTTNLCMFENFFSVYSFWDNLFITGWASQTTGGIWFGKALLHGLIPAYTPIETIVCQQFGGTPGWTNGVPNNQFAALHKAPSPNAASVSGATWLETINKACNLRLIKANPVVFNYLRAPGFGTENPIRLDDGSNLTVVNGQVDGSGFTTNYQTSATFTVDATADTITFATPQLNLFTGDAVTISSSNESVGLPGGITQPRFFAYPTYYVRNVDNNAGLVYKLAISRIASVNGAIIDLTSTGTGTLTLKSQTTAVVGVFNGSLFGFDGSISSGLNAIYVDLTSSASPDNTFFGNITSNLNFAGVGNERVVAYLHLADFKHMTGQDQVFRMSFGGHQIRLTRAVVNSAVGSVSGPAPMGGVYTGAGKTGVAVVDPEMDYSGLVFGHQIPVALSSTSKQTTYDDATQFYLYMDYAPTNGVNGDYIFYGVPMDGPS